MFVLLYRPPCGEWYIHSHKLYPSKEIARTRAQKFLPTGTPIAIIYFGDREIDQAEEYVG